MSVEGINDALAVKVATIEGIKKAFGSGAGLAGVLPIPDQIADGPVALVMYDGTEVDIPSGTVEVLRHTYLVHVYVQAPDTAYAYKVLVPFVSRFVVAFRTGRSLDGACSEATVASIDAIEPVEINSRPYARLPVRVLAREMTFGAETSI